MSAVPFAFDGFDMLPLTSSSERQRDAYRRGSGPASWGVECRPRGEIAGEGTKGAKFEHQTRRSGADQCILRSMFEDTLKPLLLKV
jgi:hypothetical protein